MWGQTGWFDGQITTRSSSMLFKECVCSQTGQEKKKKKGG